MGAADGREVVGERDGDREGKDVVGTQDGIGVVGSAVRWAVGASVCGSHRSSVRGSWQNR